MAVVLRVGTGVSSVDYDFYPGQGQPVQSGTITEVKSFTTGAYGFVKFFVDESKLSSGYSTPIYARKEYSSSTRTVIIDGPFSEDGNVSINVYATLAAYDITYDWNDGIDGPINDQKKKGDTYTIPAKKPKRSGYVFRYWTDNLETGKHWLPGDAYTRDSDVTFKAMWAAKSYFYWHGSNENDATYFQVDKRVDLAITASNWNRFCYYVNLLRDYCYLPTITFTPVSAENELSASGFNKVSNAIEDCVNYVHSTVHPPTVSKGMLVRVLHYNGSGSLKDAATSVMNALE